MWFQHLEALGTAPGVEELTIFYAADNDGDGTITAAKFEVVKPLFVDPALRAKAAQASWGESVEGASDVVMRAQQWKRKGLQGQPELGPVAGR